MRKLYLLLAFLTFNIVFLSLLIRMGIGPSTAGSKSKESMVESLSDEILRAYEEALWEHLSQSARRPPVPKAAQGPFDLQGVFWGTPHPQAIINRQIVRVGDKIGNAEAVSIGKEGVVLLLSNGQETVLRFASPNHLKSDVLQQ